MRVGVAEGTAEVADFDAVLREYRPRIFRFALASLRDRDAAETVTQDCFLRAHAAWEQFRGEASVQTCLVHLIRHSLSYCGWKERQAVAAALKLIYRAESAAMAAQRLGEFEAGEWGRKYPTIAASWRRAWEQVIPFFAYPAEVRKIIYTTNAIESLNMQLRKIIKTRGHFPSDEAATKLLYLALRNITAKWVKPPLHWSAAANQFAIQFGARFFSSSAC